MKSVCIYIMTKYDAKNGENIKETKDVNMTVQETNHH